MPKPPSLDSMEDNPNVRDRDLISYGHIADEIINRHIQKQKKQ